MAGKGRLFHPSAITTRWISDAIRGIFTRNGNSDDRPEATKTWSRVRPTLVQASTPIDQTALANQSRGVPDHPPSILESVVPRQNSCNPVWKYIAKIGCGREGGVSGSNKRGGKRLTSTHRFFSRERVTWNPSETAVADVDWKRMQSFNSRA